MATDPELLRAQGDWLAQLRQLLNMQAQAGARPAAQHRSTKKAATALLDNLRQGVGTKGAYQLDEAAVEKVVFNAVDQILSDKASESRKGKSKADAARLLRAELEAQFKARKGDQALAPDWIARMKEALGKVLMEEAGRAEASAMLDAASPGKAYAKAADQAVRDGLKAMRADVMSAQDSQLLQSQSLAQLRRELQQQAAQRAGTRPVDPAWLAEVQRSIDRLQLDELQGELDGVKMAHQRTDIVSRNLASLQDMLQRPEGRQLLAQRPDMGGIAVATLDDRQIAALDLDASFGAAKKEVLSRALQAMGQKKPVPSGAVAPDRAKQLDPKAFTALASQVSKAEWNDAQRGLGPRVFAGLFMNGNADQVEELIKAGASTNMAARAGQADGGASNGVYSGFVKPLQHLLAPALHDIARLDAGETIDDEQRKREAEAAKRIWKLIEARGEAITLTDWEQVKGCEMLKAFKKDPGTIWGFENIRMPFVEAAHEAPKGDQPLRMMEIWPSIKPMLTPSQLDELYANPGLAIQKLITKGLADGKVVNQSDAYKKAYADAVRKFITEFIEQMPKASFARRAEDDPASDVRVSEIGGVLQEKLQGGIACQVGLHWAKTEGKPVYYCLDGISMDEVADYKKVRNKAIDEFIAAGGQPAGAQGFDEVITFMEIREILKRWDELKDTVKFVLKGKVLSKAETHKLVQGAIARMRQSNQDAGRTPAPPRAHFAKQLDAIDPALMARIPDGKDGDREARDLVRKFGYLQQAARTRPQILLRYLLGKCGVLEKYGVVAPGLTREAARLVGAADVDVPKALKAIEAQIDLCHVDLRPALAKSLLRHPALSARSTT